MNINLNNYEEYFLLYADKELSDREKKAVEDFVQENLHLSGEFASIQNTVILPDESLEYAEKSSLIKSGFLPNIHENNYREIFMLYHDGELPVPERQETEKFLLSHPYLQEEFNLLGLARIQPETLLFPGKKLLYKKVAAIRPGRLIFFRVMAAASFAGLVIWASLFFSSTNGNEDPVVVQALPKPGENRPLTGERNKLQKENIAESMTDAAKTGGDAATPATKSNKYGEMAASLPPQKSLPRVRAKSKPADTLATHIIAAEDLEENMAIADKRMEEQLLTKISPKEIPLPVTTKLSASSHLDIDETEIINKQETLARTAKYIDVEQEESNGLFLNISANSLQKTKLGIFLKKAKRVAERNDPIRRLFAGEEDQVVVNR